MCQRGNFESNNINILKTFIKKTQEKDGFDWKESFDLEKLYIWISKFLHKKFQVKKNQIIIWKKS